MGTKVQPEAVGQVVLPKLKVSILREGEPLRTIEVDDPRELLIASFNQCSCETGLIAEPA